MRCPMSSTSGAGARSMCRPLKPPPFLRSAPTPPPPLSLSAPLPISPPHRPQFVQSSDNWDALASWTTHSVCALVLCCSSPRWGLTPWNMRPASHSPSLSQNHLQRRTLGGGGSIAMRNFYFVHGSEAPEENTQSKGGGGKRHTRQLPRLMQAGP